MDSLRNITVITLQSEKINIENFNEGKTWYEIICFLENPNDGVPKEEKLIKLMNYFPQEIEEYDLEKVMFNSPIYKIFAKKYFKEVESERLEAKERVGNTTCKICGSKAQEIMVQTRSADEASSIKVTCLDASCGKVYKIG